MRWLRIDKVWHAFRNGRSLCGRIDLEVIAEGGKLAPGDRFSCWKCWNSIKRERAVDAAG